MSSRATNSTFLLLLVSNFWQHLAVYHQRPTRGFEHQEQGPPFASECWFSEPGTRGKQDCTHQPSFGHID